MQFLWCGVGGHLENIVIFLRKWCSIDFCESNGNHAIFLTMTLKLEDLPSWMNSMRHYLIELAGDQLDTSTRPSYLTQWPVMIRVAKRYICFPSKKHLQFPIRFTLLISKCVLWEKLWNSDKYSCIPLVLFQCIHFPVQVLRDQGKRCPSQIPLSNSIIFRLGSNPWARKSGSRSAHFY